MAKDYTCWDCGYYGGRHEPSCPKKGYLMPSEPKSPTAAPAAAPGSTECPCGIHREDCDYHRVPTPKPYEYDAYDWAGHQIGKPESCTCKMCALRRESNALAALVPRVFAMYDMGGSFMFLEADDTHPSGYQLVAQVWK